jgi:site-specific recombinase XerD
MDTVSATASSSPRLLDLLRERIRLKHLSIRTEQAYVGWVRRYIIHHGKRHPREMGKVEVESFLTSLAVDRDVSAATQSQALSAILFLYREVLEQPLPWLDEVTRAKRPARLPVVLAVDEVQRLLAAVGNPDMALVLRLLYGTGMRLLEGLRLRVKDVDFCRREILVREGKGAKDRITMLPDSLMQPLRAQVAKVKAQHDADLALGRGEVWLRGAQSAG